MIKFIKSFATDVLSDADEILYGVRELINEALDFADEKLVEWNTLINKETADED